MRGVTLAFGPKVIQHDLSFDVRRGSIFAVMGGSGCGKSTVLKAMVGLLRPAAGQYRVEGEDYWAATEARRTEIGRRFGVLFQSGALWSALTVGENVALPLRMFTRLNDDRNRRLVRLKLGLVGHGARDRPTSLRTQRRHAQAGWPGPRAGAGPGRAVLRRAFGRPRPDHLQPASTT